jgi:hypothetical protein
MDFASLSLLPKDTLSNILLDLPLKEILRNCTLSTKFAAICQDDFFWKTYLKYQYGVNNKGKDLSTFRDTVKLCEQIVQLCFSKQSYISVRLLDDMIPVLTGSQILEDINNTSNQLFITFSEHLSDELKIMIGPSTHIELPYIKDKNSLNITNAYSNFTDLQSHYVYTSDELAIAKKYMYYSTLPDKYIFPVGSNLDDHHIVEIPLNIYNAEYITFNMKDPNTEIFFEYLYSLFHIYEYETYVKYTTFV